VSDTEGILVFAKKKGYWILCYYVGFSPDKMETFLF
jgi:hypothetical protein